MNTLPVRFGISACYVGIVGTNGAWLLGGACWWCMGRLDLAHLRVLLVGNALYRLAVWWARERLRLGKLALDYVIESITFGYALALWLLA